MQNSQVKNGEILIETSILSVTWHSSAYSDHNAKDFTVFTLLMVLTNLRSSTTRFVSKIRKKIKFHGPLVP